MLNLILGDDVLPHNILKETSTICEVKYGDNKECVVHKKNQGSQKIPLLSKEECGMSFAEQLKPYVALKEEDDREMIKIERVEIHLPHPLLKVRNVGHEMKCLVCVIMPSCCQNTASCM